MPKNLIVLILQHFENVFDAGIYKNTGTLRIVGSWKYKDMWMDFSDRYIPNPDVLYKNFFVQNISGCI